MLNRWAFLLKSAADENFFSSLHRNLEHWQTHGTSVTYSIETLYSQIILLKAKIDVSGCGQDQMKQLLHKTAVDNGVELLPNSFIAYFKNDSIICLHFTELESSLANGIIHSETQVYDFPSWLIGGILINDLKNTWISRYLPKTT